jgi:hypothetical protein
MSDPETAALIADGIIGKDAEQFIKSELGQTMIGMAEQDASDAMQKLKGVLPWRRRAIQRLQNEIALSERFQSYLQELYVRGQQAIDQLEAREE